MKESKYLEEKNELVDIVHCAFNDWDNYNDDCYFEHISPIESVEDFVADAVLHAGYRKQEWISVEDAMPEENEIYCVIVANRKSHKCTKRTHARYKNGRWLDLYDNWENACWIVTHWMPLPSAPKGE